MIKYHRDRYPDVHADEVTRIVLKTFGEIASCKIAHTQKLTKYITEQEVDDAFRTEEPLAVSLMGLLAEDSLIGQRLAKLGPKKLPKPPEICGEHTSGPPGLIH